MLAVLLGEFFVYFENGMEMKHNSETGQLTKNILIEQIMLESVLFLVHFFQPFGVI